MLDREEIKGFVSKAIGGDIFDESTGGFVGVMARSSAGVQKDIPAAMEMYTLLDYFMYSLPLASRYLAFDAEPIPLEPGIVVSEQGDKIVALLPIQAQQLTEVAFWLADALPSREVKAMPGLLTLMFSVEAHDDVQHLLPEWTAAFYVQSNKDHCIPILALRSVLDDERFGGDWVTVALHRMSEFGLPQQAAFDAAGGEIQTTR